jgi:hypothetical protein
MNCQDFNDRLFDYLDDTLSPAEEVAAREHAQQCGSCCRALEQQQAFAKSIRFSFDRETQRLSLRLDTRRDILSAVTRPKVPLTGWENIQAFFAVLRRQPAWAGAVLLCLVLLLTFANRLYLALGKHPSPQARVTDNRITYVVDVPIRTEMYLYRRHNNMVVDALVTEISVMNASYSENMAPSRSSQPHIN